MDGERVPQRGWYPMADDAPVPYGRCSLVQYRPPDDTMSACTTASTVTSPPQTSPGASSASQGLCVTVRPHADGPAIAEECPQNLRIGRGASAVGSKISGSARGEERDQAARRAVGGQDRQARRGIGDRTERDRSRGGAGPSPSPRGWHVGASAAAMSPEILRRNGGGPCGANDRAETWSMRSQRSHVTKKGPEGASISGERAFSG